MSREAREVIADWLILFGAVGLLLALFMPWSHQFSHAFLAQRAVATAVRDVPRNPTAWQVYSVVDVLLALLVVGLLASALRGGRYTRIVVLAGCAVAVAFSVHAMSVPPTNGTNINFTGPGFVTNTASSGTGEVVAVIALGVAITGVALSFTAE